MKVSNEDAWELAFMRPGDSVDLPNGEHLKCVSRESGHHGRWHVQHTSVFEDREGRLWGMIYGIGATEMQEHEICFGDSLELDPYEAHEVSVVEYRPVPKPSAKGAGA